MRWTLQEKHGREQLQLFLLAAWFSASASLLSVAWLTWGVWTELHGGERAIASARQSYEMMAFFVLAANA